MILRTAPDARAQARRLAAQIARVLTNAVAKRGHASLAVSGGDTPGLLFDALARTPAPWRRIGVTLTDERWSDPKSAASNERQVRARLLRARAQGARFVPLKTARATPRAALSGVAHRLRPLLPLDVCVLGMGGDGHIASLFPGAPLATRAALTPVHIAGARGAAERLSLSLRTIAAARLVIVLIRGPEKRTALTQHLATTAPETPIRALLQTRHAPTYVSWSPT